jgi:hypothetical protein
LATLALQVAVHQHDAQAHPAEILSAAPRSFLNMLSIRIIGRKVNPGQVLQLHGEKFYAQHGATHCNTLQRFGGAIRVLHPGVLPRLCFGLVRIVGCCGAKVQRFQRSFAKAPKEYVE